MKIVIDIPEETYNFIKENSSGSTAHEAIKNGTPLPKGQRMKDDFISRQAAIDAINTMFAPTPTQMDMKEDCLEIIENLPSALPKGHGDLIDRKALMNRPYETGGFVEWYDEIKYAPTIIEADKEQT